MSIIEHANYYENPMYNVSHSHTSCEILYLVEGQIEVTAGKNHVIIYPNDCLLIKSRQHHDVKIATDIRYTRFVTIINPWELRNQLVRPDLFSMLTDTSQSGFIVVRNNPELLTHFEKMLNVFCNGGNIYSEMSAVLSVISVFYDVCNPPCDKAQNHSSKRIADTIRDFIEKNFAENIKISQIAENNFISAGYLTHLFKKEVGLSPREYLSHIRCTRAYELIKHTSMKLSDISIAVGFCCANDMSRKLREYYGLTPTQIRYKI